MNKTADTILEELPCIACDGSGAYQTNNDGDIEQCQYCYQFRFPFKEKAQQALMNDILALIEQMPERGFGVPAVGTDDHNKGIFTKHISAQELTAALRQYFGQDNQEGKT